MIPLALDTPKLWERFSLGLDSLVLLDRKTTESQTRPPRVDTRVERLLLGGLRVHPLEHGPPGLGPAGAGQRLLRLRPHS